MAGPAGQDLACISFGVNEFGPRGGVVQENIGSSRLLLDDKNPADADRVLALGCACVLSMSVDSAAQMSHVMAEP